jgi:DNA-binding transcriptional MerR regulator
MYIGSMAKKVGLSPDAIRFYERKNLLPGPPRTLGGFREYAEMHIETLEFIRRVQGLGFTLREIRELLDLRRRSRPCAMVHRRLQQKLLDVRRKREALRILENELYAAVRGCEKQLHKRSKRCPLLSSPGEKTRRRGR